MPLSSLDPRSDSTQSSLGDRTTVSAVLAARCPVCGHGGSVILGFGPQSSPEGAAIVIGIPDHTVHVAGA